MTRMNKIQVFVSFDIEHDGELYERLVEQSQGPSSTFEVSNGSRRSPDMEVCSESARQRISNAEQMIVICGEHTEASIRVGAELLAAQHEGTPYFLVWGRREAMCTKPIGAKPADWMYSWTQRVVEDQVALIARKARGETTARVLADATRNGRPSPSDVAAYS